MRKENVFIQKHIITKCMKTCRVYKDDVFVCVLFSIPYIPCALSSSSFIRFSLHFPTSFRIGLCFHAVGR